MGKGVIEVTRPIELEIVGDRLFAVVASGDCVTTYALPFYLASNAAREALRVIGEHQVARVIRLPRKGAPLPHG